MVVVVLSQPWCLICGFGERSCKKKLRFELRNHVGIVVHGFLANIVVHWSTTCITNRGFAISIVFFFLSLPLSISLDCLLCLNEMHVSFVSHLTDILTDESIWQVCVVQGAN